MDQELHHELAPKRTEHYRDEAKALLRALRSGDAAAVRRATDGVGPRWQTRFVLADALHVVAVEHGHRSWPAFKHALDARAGAATRPVGRIGAAPASDYAQAAERLLCLARDGDQAALARLRERVPRLSDLSEAEIAERTSAGDARVCVAHEYGFRTWDELAQAADRAHEEHPGGLPADSPWKLAEAAIRAGDADRLQRLLAEHPGLEREDRGMTLLGAAAQPEAGQVPREVIDALVEAGSELDVPLNLAACFNKADLVGWLLDAGADATSTQIWGITPLQTAAYHSSREAADVLVRRTGLHPDALYIAAIANDLDRLAAWFDSGGRLRPQAARARPNLGDVGWPPQPPPSSDPADIVAEALSLAAGMGRTRACEFLLDRGADPARGPLYGLTPLHFAAWYGRREAIALLVSRGAPLDVRDRLHRGTPLGWALHHGHRGDELIRLLGGPKPSPER